MNQYKEFPFTLINNFIADFLADRDIMAKQLTIKGNPQPSIVPAAQTPELVDAFSPGVERAPAFMVYGFGLDQHDTEDYMNCEKLEYTVYSPTVGKVMSIVEAMEDFFSRRSWSAEDLNSYYMTKFPGKTLPFTFLQTTFEMVAGPVPMTNEGGRYGAMFTIHYEYVNPVNGTPGQYQGMRI